jgi:hypothetical protein
MPATDPNSSALGNPIEQENTMSNPDAQQIIDSTARVCQIITVALLTGAVIILGVSIALDPLASTRPAGNSLDIGQILTWVLLAFAAISAVMYFLVPGLITSQRRRRIAATTAPSGRDALAADTGELAGLYQAQYIVGAATCEGPAFLAAIAYMLGKNPIALGVLCLLLAVLILRFPTRRRVADWIDRQQELLIHERRGAI